MEKSNDQIADDFINQLKNLFNQCFKTEQARSENLAKTLRIMAKKFRDIADTLAPDVDAPKGKLC